LSRGSARLLIVTTGDGVTRASLAARGGGDATAPPREESVASV